jgi:predicted amidohydrolase YtcJ
VLIARCEIGGVAPLDVRIADGRIAEIGRGLARHADEPVLDTAGGALLPGLHDHHLHLLALAAAESSLRCGPPEVCDADDLAQALAGAGGGGAWMRGVGYHESVAGEIDRARLAALVPDHPVRIQHRSGALWVVNSAGVDRLDLDRGAEAPGVERDDDGRATGRLFRLDAWLRERIEPGGPPSLESVSRRLASFGVTGLTDATATNGSGALGALVAAAERGELLQRLVVMGGPELPDSGCAAVERGALKLMLDERALPEFEALRGAIAAAHRGDRSVAVHCVTRAELVLATAAFAAAGSRAGDRIEHASVAPPDALPPLAELGLTVVTQPNFVFERGDAYLVDVEPRDRPYLYRGRGFLDASVPLGGGTDAPFGDPDPWKAMRAAVDRRTEAGAALGPEEALTPERALALFTSPASAPGGPPRPIDVGTPADLCLLDRPWSKARSKLSSELVAAAIRGDSILWQRGRC